MRAATCGVAVGLVWQHDIGHLSTILVVGVVVVVVVVAAAAAAADLVDVVVCDDDDDDLVAAAAADAAADHDAEGACNQVRSDDHTTIHRRQNVMRHGAIVVLSQVRRSTQRAECAILQPHA